MKFIDEVSIHVKAGKGGSGCKHFRREKFVPYGGPDGGNGGAGGSVILVADAGILTLLDFRHRPSWEAQDGNPGEASRREGKSGEDLIIKVPVGTEVIDEKSGALLKDLAESGQEFIVAQGGRGGKGNDFFKSATNRVPEQFQPGEVGQERDIKLSLKLVADVGIIGYPNAGKSTLISRISAAKPKIADYPFTTLVPNLGVVRTKDKRSFVVADIPGLIPGAHEGKGLGIRFLKHVERTRALLHLIDLNAYDESGTKRSLWEVFEDVQRELDGFSKETGAKEQIIVLTKADTISDPQEIEEAKKLFREKGLKVLVISSVSGQGIEELVDQLSQLVLGTGPALKSPE